MTYEMSWPVNHISKGYINRNLMGIGRSAKIVREDGNLYYAVVGGIELHGEEGNKAGLERAPEKKKGIGKDVRAETLCTVHT